MLAPLLAAGIAAAFLVHVALLAGIAEDAFITFRFARHVAAGLGFVWNPGEAPVEGYTNFLWLLLSAALQALGIDPLRGAQAAGVAVSGAALLYVFRGGRWLGWTPGFALLPCAFLALSGPFATWAAAGLETNLFAALVVAGVFHLARGVGEGGRGDRWAGCLALLAAALTRPEGVLVGGVVLAAAALASLDRPARAARELAAPLGVVAALFAAYTAWRVATFGYWLPNTFYAKTGGGLEQVARGAQYARWFLWHYGTPWLVVLALAALPAGRRGEAAAGPAASRLARWLRANALLATAGAVSLAWLAAVVGLGGDYMAMYRFFVPVLPLLHLLLGAATRRALLTPALSPGPRRAIAGAGLVVAALGTAVHSTPLEAALFRVPPRMHGNWRGVATERWHVSRLSTIGRFFRDYARPEESLVTDAIGAIGWYSGLRVWGVHGIVDPVLAHRPAGDRRVGRGVAGHERRDLAFVVEQRQPGFVMVGRELTPRRPSRARLPSDVAAALRGRYRLVSVWLEDPGNREAGWFAFFERRDRGGGPAPAR